MIKPEAQADPAEVRWEALRLKAYRQARVFEPSMDGYAAAMAVYSAVFGPPDGEPTVVLPDGSTKQGWELQLPEAAEARSVSPQQEQQQVMAGSEVVGWEGTSTATRSPRRSATAGVSGASSMLGAESAGSDEPAKPSVGTSHFEEGRIAAITARLEAATKGPWVTWSEEGKNRGGAYLHSVCYAPLTDAGVVDWGRDGEHQCIAETQRPTRDQARADAEFVAHARQDIPYLLDLVSTLTQRGQQLATYVQHKSECEIVRPRQFYGVTLGEGGRCTCGLRELLALSGRR